MKLKLLKSLSLLALAIPAAAYAGKHASTGNPHVAPTASAQNFRANGSPAGNAISHHITFQNSGAYLAHFYLSWQEPVGNPAPGQRPRYQMRNWDSGDVPVGYRATINIPAGSPVALVSSTIMVFPGQNRQVISEKMVPPANTCYNLSGVTFSPSVSKTKC